MFSRSLTSRENVEANFDQAVQIKMIKLFWTSISCFWPQCHIENMHILGTWVTLSASVMWFALILKCVSAEIILVSLDQYTTALTFLWFCVCIRVHVRMCWCICLPAYVSAIWDTQSGRSRLANSRVFCEWTNRQSNYRLLRTLVNHTVLQYEGKHVLHYLEETWEPVLKHRAHSQFLYRRSRIALNVTADTDFPSLQPWWLCYRSKINGNLSGIVISKILTYSVGSARTVVWMISLWATCIGEVDCGSSTEYKNSNVFSTVRCLVQSPNALYRINIPVISSLLYPGPLFLKLVCNNVMHFCMSVFFDFALVSSCPLETSKSPVFCLEITTGSLTLLRHSSDQANALRDIHCKTISSPTDSRQTVEKVRSDCVANCILHCAVVAVTETVPMLHPTMSILIHGVTENKGWLDVHSCKRANRRWVKYKTAYSCSSRSQCFFRK